MTEQGLAVREALSWAKDKLENASDSAILEAQILLGDVLSVDRAHMLAHPEQILTAEQQTRYTALVERAAAGEPLPYILGRWAFYDREFIITPAVLIPRPETELLVERGLAFARSHPRCIAVDVGTGSGALAVTLAANCPEVTVYATDISPAALAVARQNAAANGAKVIFLQGDLLAPLLERGIKVDLIMANLPYIPTDDLAALAVSRYEPRLALDGGADGLDLMRQLFKQAPDVCNPGARILLEIGADQGATALALAQAAFPKGEVEVIKDYAGLDRIVQIDLGGK